eukprot:12423940-Karenia_brevis.AAC.1
MAPCSPAPNLLSPRPSTLSMMILIASLGQLQLELLRLDKPLPPMAKDQLPEAIHVRANSAWMWLNLNASRSQYEWSAGSAILATGKLLEWHAQ